MRGVLLGAGAAAIVALGAAPAAAAVIFFDDFEGETLTDPGGAWSRDYASFANFFVRDGTVDLLGSRNRFGLLGGGKFVDLDGSTRNGGVLETIAQFDFNPGDFVTLSFTAGGSQRGGADNLYGGFRFFGAAPTYANATLGSFASLQEPTPTSHLLTGMNPSLASAAAFQTYSVSFRATTAGRFSAVIGTNSADNVGPLIDNVSISLVPAPEPASWAMMVLGFGMAGGLMRRRRARTAI